MRRLSDPFALIVPGDLAARLAIRLGRGDGILPVAWPVRAAAEPGRELVAGGGVLVAGMGRREARVMAGWCGCGHNFGCWDM